MKTTTFTKILKNQNGSALLVAIGVIAATAISTIFLSQRSIQLKKQVENNLSNLQLRLALHSTVDYVLFGIKQKWCFSEKLLPEADCTLEHPASTERILMSKDQEIFIRTNKVFKGVLPEPLRTVEFSRTIDVSKLTSNHPLFKMTTSLVRAKFNKIFVKVRREMDPALPISGREVYLRVYVSISDDPKGIPIKIGQFPLQAESLVTVMPRELGAFSLVAAGDLHLDLPFDTVAAPGDIYLHKFSSDKDLGGSTGLIFESPIFVNRNIHLPFSESDPDRKRPELGYTPVTFASKVYLGDGKILSNKKPYRPSKSGNAGEEFWSENKLFGSFLRGIENDGARDGGLDFLGKVTAGSEASASLIQKCIQRSLAKVDKNLLSNSKLIGQKKDAVLPGNAVGSKFRLALTNSMDFGAQENAAQGPLKSAWDGTATVSGRTNPIVNAVVHLALPQGQKSVSAQLSRDSSLEALPKIITTSEPKLSTDISKTEDDIDALKAKIALNQVKKQQKQALIQPKIDEIQSLNDQINDLKSDVQNLNNQISTENGKNPKDQNLINNLSNSRNSKQNQINNLENDIGNLNSSIAGIQNDINQLNNLINSDTTKLSQAVSDLASLEARLDFVRDLEANPPKIRVEIQGVKIGSDLQPHLLDLNVVILNGHNLRDEFGVVFAPNIEIFGYDATFYKSQSIEIQNTSRLLRFLNFSKAGNVLSAPTGLSTQSNSPTASTAAVSVENLGELDALCANQSLFTSGSAFGGANWDYSFAPSSRNSWNFAAFADGTPSTSADVAAVFGNIAEGRPKDPAAAFVANAALDEVIFDGGNSKPGNTKFQVRSIVGVCTIKSTAELIVGFLTCDKLIIESRLTPLRIIGTIIVGQAKIDPSALKAGIRWSSIYHPQAVTELRRAKILKTVSGQDCVRSTVPVWHPTPDIREVQNRYSCNVISLRAKADPFQWTAVDPDCGLMPNASATVCKRRLLRYFVVEQSRESGI